MKDNLGPAKPMQNHRKDRRKDSRATRARVDELVELARSKGFRVVRGSELAAAVVDPSPSPFAGSQADGETARRPLRDLHR